MAEPPVQLADMNTQTVVPELSVHFSRPANSPVNLTDAGDPLSDPHLVQSASNGLPLSFVSSYGFSCARNNPKYLEEYLCWFQLQVISLIIVVYAADCNGQAPGASLL